MRTLVLALALLLAAPLAQAAVTIDRVEVPERTRAERPFDVNVTLANDGAARTVYLFGALYDAEEGKTCGSSADPRFRTFTHMVQEPVALPAQSVTRHPAEGARWLHRYDASAAAAAPEDAELCIFVANASAGPLIDYEAFAPAQLSVRAVNAAPTATFRWSPERPGAAQEVAFEAQGQDAEGDPISYQWDFGHADASGRAGATGATAVDSFYPAGVYVVTLVATDGMDATSVSREIEIAGGASDAPERSRIPATVTLAVAAALVALALRRPPPRRSR